MPFKSRFVGNAGLPAWQIVMHLVNHGTLHRGQFVGMLRQLGVKPPTTDILFYFFPSVADTPWESREFVVKDCDGRRLAFGAQTK